jgi:heme-degrading monooxygenase HmoA
MKMLIWLLSIVTVIASAQGAPENAQSLFDGAMAKMQQAGALAQQGKFAPANELVTVASAELDRAVALAPDDLELRARRGLLFSRMPYLPGKAAQSKQDLLFVKDHPKFQELPESLRTSVVATLAGAHRDRFPQISDGTSPVIAAMNFTTPPQPNGTVPNWVAATALAIKGYPGLLGTHAVASVDHPGMYIIFTWWTNKDALNRFFYSDLHQSWMQRRGATMARADTPSPELAPTQTAAEVLADLPGGVRINGGFVPQAVLERSSPAKTP